MTSITLKDIKYNYPSSGFYREVYDYFKSNEDYINSVTFSGTTLIEFAFYNQRYDMIRALLKLDCHMETFGEGYNLMDSFFKYCFNSRIPFEPEELLSVIEMMMDNSSTEWNLANEDSGITCADRVNYCMVSEYGLGKYRYIQDKIVYLVSMSMNDWKKEKKWRRRKQIIANRKMNRISMGLGN
jgi:hypothetical protein